MFSIIGTVMNRGTRILRVIHGRDARATIFSKSITIAARQHFADPPPGPSQFRWRPAAAFRAPDRVPPASTGNRHYAAPKRSRLSIQFPQDVWFAAGQSARARTRRDSVRYAVQDWRLRQRIARLVRAG